MSQKLFDGEEFHSRSAVPPIEAPASRPRLREPVRDQIEFQTASLEQLLPPDHEARLVWSAVCQLDLGSWLGEIKAVEGRVGRDATTPQLLVALWVYATLRGIASARELERLCHNHLAYRWLCGGVSVNHHLLSDFRSTGGDKWDGLLTQLVGALMSEGLVTLDRVAQDGMRVRASAGKSSFRRKATLEKCLEEAREQVTVLRQLAEEDTAQLSARRRDSEIIAQWRARMGTEEAQQIYRLRPQTAEWVNAQARNRNLWRMPVRGLTKCRIIAVLYALAHNLLQAVGLRAAAAISTIEIRV